MAGYKDEIVSMRGLLLRDGLLERLEAWCGCPGAAQKSLSTDPLRV